MSDSYFRRLGGADAAGRYEASHLTAGPWSPTLQHGGPPNALAVLLADRVVRAQGRNDLQPLRLAADFLGPVPVGELDVEVRVLRLARSAAACEVTVSAAERVSLVVRVWFVRESDTRDIATPPVVVAAPPPDDLPDRAHSTAHGWGFGYAESLRWWFTDGRPDHLGPAAAWVRPLHPLLDEASGALPGLARVALVADSASGISAELDWAQWSFANVDLDVHVSRPLAGDWVHMAAETTLGPSGSALTRSVLGDREGRLGAGLQTLVVARAPRR